MAMTGGPTPIGVWMEYVNGGPPGLLLSAVAVGKKIYSFDGSYNKNHTAPENIHVYVLNTAGARQWQLVSAVDDNAGPSRHYGYAVVAHNKNIYLWCGETGSQSQNRLHCFDTTSLKWSQPEISGETPHISFGHTACVIGDYMYIFGGKEAGTFTPKKTISRISLTTFIWETIPTHGTPPTYLHSCASVIGTRAYIFGGNNIDDKDGTGLINRIFYFEAATMQWVWPTTKGIPPCGRVYHSTFVHKGQLFITPGCSDVSDRNFNDLFKFDIATDTWYEVDCYGIPPNPEKKQCYCVVQDRIYVLSGISSSYITQFFMGMESRDENADLYILNLDSSLYRRCLTKVMHSNIDQSRLPKHIRSDIDAMLPGRKRPKVVH